jgi:integrase
MKQLVKLNIRSWDNGRRTAFILRYTDGNGNRKFKTLTGIDKKKAEKERAKLERELSMGVVEPGSMRLKSFLKDSLKRTGDQIRESTRDEYESAMKDFIKKIGNMDYQKVTIENGEKYRQVCLDSGNSPATVTKKLKHLKRLFQLAVNRKQLEENPFKHIDMPKVRKKKIRIYSDAECQRMMKAAQQYCREWNLECCPQWDLLIIVALITAMRRAELLNCTWHDVDFEEQVINITPKEDTKHTWRWDIKDTDERTLPLTDEVTQLLVDHQAKQPEGYPYVFVPVSRYDFIQNLRGKGEWKYSDSRLKVVNNFTRQFEKILKSANVKKGQFHDLRRTAITSWFANGMSENDVMVLAGHANFATTHEFYLAVADDLVDRARKASAQNPGSIFGANWCKDVFAKTTSKAANCNQLPAKEL